MSRTPRFAPPGHFLHLTQRGNYRQRTFFTDADRHRYLQLLDRHSTERDVTLLGYCVMSNHVHLLARGEREGAISEFMKAVNGEYALNLHARLGRKGRLWQGRFYSSVVDERHLTVVLRYIERNPVRAQMVSEAFDYRWSSARAHLGISEHPAWLDQQSFDSRWTRQEWESFLISEQSRREVAAVRLASRRDRPIATESFIKELETQWGVRLLPKPPGRPKKEPGSEVSLHGGPIAAQACS